MQDAENDGASIQGKRSLLVSGVVTLLASSPFLARLFYEEVVLTYEQGPQMLGFSMMHIMPYAIIFGFLSLIALHIWILIALAEIVCAAWKRQRLRRAVEFVLAVALFSVLLAYTPYGWWRFLIFQTVGPGKHGGSQLKFAAESGELYNVRALVGCGIRVDALEDDETTALMSASAAGHLNVVKYLVNAGAPVNYQERSLGRNALMSAVKMDHPSVVSYLLKCGADRTLPDKAGRTALDMAREKKDPRMLAASEAKQ
ncbi:MAG: ankyrin repeat domain-containing protein [Paludibaculum sp.]